MKKKVTIRRMQNPIYKVKNIMGPFRYTGPQTRNILSYMEGKFFEFIISIHDIIEANKKNKPQVPLYKNVIFPGNINLGQIALINEIIIVNKADGIKGNKIALIYDTDWNIISQARSAVQSTGFGFVKMLIYVTPKIDFYGVKNSHPINGYVLSYAEPIQKCNDVPLDTLLACLPYMDDKIFYESDERWSTFSMTGEPLPIYNVDEFIDEDRNVSEWPYSRLTKEILYIETDKNRYEFIMEAIDSFSLYRLLDNNVTYYAMSLTGRPVGALGKVKVATGIEWKQIVWGKDDIRFNKLKISNIRAVFWMLKAE